MAPMVPALARPLSSGFAVALMMNAACASRHPPSASLPASAAAVVVPARASVSQQEGYATYLARSFHGRTSASGETFDERRLVAAHRTLPFGSVVRVTNVANGRSVTVRIIDRGPYGKNYREGTVIDLSRAAARRLRMLRDGQVRARVEVLRLGEKR